MMNTVKNLKIFLSPVKYFSQRLFNYGQTLALNTDCIFFASDIMQSKSLKGKINIAMQNVSDISLNVAVLNNSYFNETVRKWVSNEQGFRFMSSVKGTPPYWQKFKSEILTMVKQLVLQHFFSRYHVQILGGRNFLR